MNTGKKTEEKVFSYIEEHGILQMGDRVVAGVSGGADSVCLLLVLQEYRKQTPIELAVVHVNHGIRSDAGKDAAFVEELCRRENIPFYLRTEDVKKYAFEEKCSEEDAGRRLRYRAFEEAAADFGANKIAVAHNSNDRAETMLFHLFRGSGLKGLRGILPVRDNVIRPILCLERQEIEEYLREREICWCTDSTNAGDDYARNRIRHHILSYAEQEIFPGTVEHMGRTADLMAETENYLEEQTTEALERCIFSREKGTPGEGLVRAELDVERFLDCHPVIEKRMLLALAEELSPTGKDIEAVHIRDVLTLFTREGNRSISLPMGITAYRQYGKVVLEKGTRRQQEKAPVVPEMEFSDFFMEKGKEVPRNQYTKWFDYDKMKEPPVIRFRQTGDFLTVADGNGQMIHKSLKDYMITEKIPREMRDRIPVLAEGSHVLWLIGYRISEYYKVDRNTKRVLQVKLKRDCADMETEEKDGRTH
ncbi:MAG: tRNA lysidine(34) synthetase TilS [Acetatifactor sp.]